MKSDELNELISELPEEMQEEIKELFNSGQNPGEIIKKTLRRFADVDTNDLNDTGFMFNMVISMSHSELDMWKHKTGFQPTREKYRQRLMMKATKEVVELADMMEMATYKNEKRVVSNDVIRIQLMAVFHSFLLVATLKQEWCEDVGLIEITRAIKGLDETRETLEYKVDKMLEIIRMYSVEADGMDRAIAGRNKALTTSILLTGDFVYHELKEDFNEWLNDYYLYHAHCLSLANVKKEPSNARFIEDFVGNLETNKIASKFKHELKKRM